LNLRGAFKTPTSLAVRRTRPGYATSPNTHLGYSTSRRLIEVFGSGQLLRGYSRPMDMHPIVLKNFWRLKVNGTIHAGAHMGEEREIYARLGFGPVTWIEAIPRLAELVRELTPPEDKVINATLWSRSGHNLSFKVTNATGSSSLFDLAEHQVEYPGIFVEERLEVVTATLDDLGLDRNSNLLVLDLQGAEFEALQGGTETLRSIEYILTEVNRRELYSGIKQVNDLDTFLRLQGFYRAATRWTRHGWGEALYLLHPEGGIVIQGWSKLRRLVFWTWLHLFEIPIVAVRRFVGDVSKHLV
jgi:FkbM family methyltransferase